MAAHFYLIAKVSLFHICNLESSNSVIVVEIERPLVEQHVDVSAAVNMAVEVDVGVAEPLMRSLVFG